MDLEARLAEQLEEGLSDGDTTSEPDPPGKSPRDLMGPTALNYDLLPPASRPEPTTDPPLFNHSATPSTNIYTAASITGASLFTSTLPSYSVAPGFFATEAPSQVRDPASGALLTPTTYGQAPSVANAPSLQESPFSVPLVTSRLPEPSSSPLHNNALALVTSEMKDVSKAQQRLDYNQDLPPSR